MATIGFYGDFPDSWTDEQKRAALALERGIATIDLPDDWLTEPTAEEPSDGCRDA